LSEFDSLEMKRHLVAENLEINLSENQPILMSNQSHAPHWATLIWCKIRSLRF